MTWPQALTCCAGCCLRRLLRCCEWEHTAQKFATRRVPSSVAAEQGLRRSASAAEAVANNAAHTKANSATRLPTEADGAAEGALSY